MEVLQQIFPITRSGRKWTIVRQPKFGDFLRRLRHPTDDEARAILEGVLRDGRVRQGREIIPLGQNWEMNYALLVRARPEEHLKVGQGGELVPVPDGHFAVEQAEVISAYTDEPIRMRFITGERIEEFTADTPCIVLEY